MFLSSKAKHTSKVRLSLLIEYIGLPDQVNRLLKKQFLKSLTVKICRLYPEMKLLIYCVLQFFLSLEVVM